MANETQLFNPFFSQSEMDTRAWVTSMLIRGSGLDVGPLHRPMPIPPHAEVSYVDRMPKRELLEQYPELSHLPIVDPDIVDNGETLNTVADSSQDFVIASHFIEHTQDPFGTIKTYCRVVKPGGTILLIVPEKRAFFDKERPLTTFDHLVEDHELGPQYSVRKHYIEYAELVDHASGDDAFLHAAALKARNYSIHFHVWTGETFLEQVARAKERYSLPIDLIAGLRSHGELIAVYRRT